MLNWEISAQTRANWFPYLPVKITALGLKVVRTQMRANQWFVGGTASWHVLWDPQSTPQAVEIEISEIQEISHRKLHLVHLLKDRKIRPQRPPLRPTYLTSPHPSLT